MSRIFRPRGIEADGLKYYQERNKSRDYISIDPSTNEYYLDNGLGNLFEGRCTAIQGAVNSVCTSSVSHNFLHSRCRRVAKASIPAEWLDVL
jgi:hypothetical protein